MDASLFFAAFVLAMCVLHGVWTISVRLNVWWRNHVPLPKKPAAGKNGKAPQRSDWYAYFHCADLIGKEQASRKSPPDLPDRRVADRKSYRSPRVSAC